MQRIVHDLVQGSPEWHAFRLEHNGASEAAAMLGISTKVKRSELLRAKHTGLAKEFSEWVEKNILEHGHAVEAMARPIVEEMIGQDLYPATYSLGKLSASCDGITMDEETAFEHKQWNEILAIALFNGILPDEFMPQCQQIMKVTGAKRVIFVCSDGTRENFESIEVLPNKEWQDKIAYGWDQFERDLAEYQVVESAPAPKGATVDALPVLCVELVGQVTSSNLDQWRGVVIHRIEGINTNLQTDQDFADAESMIKFLDEGEKTLKLVKDQALNQAKPIADTFAAIDSISAAMRDKRLALEKTVKSRKEDIKTEAVMRGTNALRKFIDECNEAIGKPFMPIVVADFAGAIKGKKTKATLNEAVDTALANAKTEATQIRDRIIANMKQLQAEAGETYAGLFADLRHICTKQEDDFTALVKMRISEEKRRQDEQRAAAEAAAAQAAAKLAEAKAAPQEQPANVVSMPPTAGESDSGEEITLGEICNRLGFAVSAAFLESLGFAASTKKSAKLYPEGQFPAICRRISDHVLSIAFKKAA